VGRRQLLSGGYNERSGVTEGISVPARSHSCAADAAWYITPGQATASSQVAVCSLHRARQDQRRKCPSPHLPFFISTAPGYLRLQAAVNREAAKSLDLLVPDLH